MQIKTMVCGPIDVNTYVISNGTRECIVIDPADARLVNEYCAKQELRVTHVLLTHGHFDHILGVAQLQREGARVYIHELDAQALHDDRENLSISASFGVEPCNADVLVEDGGVITACGLTIDVMHTPGHSRGGVCYMIAQERVIFTGDTLFRLSVGRSDLPGGSARTLNESICSKLLTLTGDYKLYPGHMGDSTLESERANNPFINRWEPEVW